MANLRRFSKGKVLFSGQESLMAQSIQVTLTGGQTAVSTLALGVAGNVQGPTMIRIQVEQAVPVNGFEVQGFKFCLNNEFVEIGYYVAGELMIAQVWCPEASVQTQIDGEDKISLTFEGPGVEFKAVGQP